MSVSLFAMMMSGTGCVVHSELQRSGNCWMKDKGGKIDRFEIPGIRAVHFLLRDHLDRGVNSSSSYDCLGKNVCEYLWYKKLDIPTLFSDRGKI